MKCKSARLLAARTLQTSRRMQDITTELENVHGGSKRALLNGARTVLRKGGEALERVGNWAGGALALKEGWDYLRGGGGSQQQTPAPAGSQE